MTLLQPRRERRAGVVLSPGVGGPDWARRAPAGRRFGSSVDTMANDPEQARRHSAVFACRDLISRMVSTLPLDEYRRVGGRSTNPQSRLQPVEDPAPWLEMFHNLRPATDGVYVTVDSALARGFSAARLSNFNRDGWPMTITDISPEDVRVKAYERGFSGTPEFYVGRTRMAVWPDISASSGDSLAIMQGFPLAGHPLGVAPLTYAALSTAVGINAQDFGAGFFADGAIPVGILHNENEATPDAREAVLDDWETGLFGNRRTRVLSHGWQYRALSIVPEESQFLRTVQASVADVCRYYGVDPRDIGSSITGAGSLTYSNPELDQLRLLVRTIGPWVVRLERFLSSLRPRGREVRFNLDALLRVDTLTRHKAYESAIRNGWMNVNEVRALEDRPTIGDQGEQYLWPPMRQQLDTPELEQGADGDAAGAASSPLAEEED